MKKLFGISAAVIGLLTLNAHSQAQTITSIQFGTSGNALAPTDVAGVDGTEANWNSVVLNGSPWVYNGNPPVQYSNSASSGLVTSTGGASPIGYSITDGGTAYGTNEGLSGADGKLLSDGATTYGAYTGVNGSGGTPNGNYYSSPVVLTLNNLNPLDTYSFAVYVTGSAYTLSQGSVSLSMGGTQYFTTGDGGFAATELTSYETSPSSSDIGAAYPNQPGTAANFESNYLYFQGITGVTSETISLTDLGSYPYGTYVAAGDPAQYNNSFGNAALSLSGVQVFDVPEPATVWLFALGFAGLVFQIQRKRLAKL